MNVNYRIFLLLFFFLQPYILTGCSAKKPPKITEEVLLDTGVKNAEDEEYIKAEESYKKLLENYPDSKLRIQAQIGLADVLLKQKKFGEAIFEYQKFIDLYPASTNIDKAYYFKGLSYYKQKNSIDRNQSYLEDALTQFEYLISTFPESTYHEQTKKHIETAIQEIAQKIFYIGKFYYRISSYHAAINRFKQFLDEYKEMDFSDEVIFYLAKSYKKRENFNKATILFNTLIAEYPDSKFTHKAKNILSSMSNKSSL